MFDDLGHPHPLLGRVALRATSATVLQMDVEGVDDIARAWLAFGNQGGAAVGWHQRQHGITGVGRLVLEIDSGVVVQQHAAGEHREHDVRRRRLPSGSCTTPGLDGVEGITALGIGADAAKTLERIVGQRTLILRIGEAALRVGLPNLEHAVDDRRRHRRSLRNGCDHQKYQASRDCRRRRRSTHGEIGTDRLRRGQSIRMLGLHLLGFHRCGVAPAQHNVEAIAQRPIGLGIVEIERGNHPHPRLPVGHRVEDRIEREQGVFRKIHLRHQTRDEGVAVKWMWAGRHALW